MRSTSLGWVIVIAIVLTTSGCAAETPQEPAAEVAAAAVATVEVKAPDASASWPRFHGRSGFNVAPDTGLLDQWPENGPPLVWTATGIGDGYSSVTIADGRIFTAGNRDGKTVVTAVDLEGAILWQTNNGPAWEDSYEGSRSTPTVDGDRVYHQSPLGQVSCFNAADGTKVWSVNLLKTFGSENIRWGLSESLLVDGNHVIACPGGPKTSVVALDKATGDMVWASPSTSAAAGYASPVVAEVGERRIILTMNSQALIGVDAATGDLLLSWKHETSYDVNATMPIYRDGQVFISSGYGSGSEMLSLTPDGRKYKVEQLWQSDALDNQHGGVILLGDHLYGAAHKGSRGKWVCLDWKTGEVKYTEKGVGMGSAVAADGKLFTLSEKGKMGLVPATPSGHQVVSSFVLPPSGKGASWAHPVVCGGRLYLRHRDNLWSYEVRK